MRGECGVSVECECECECGVIYAMQEVMLLQGLAIPLKSKSFLGYPPPPPPPPPSFGTGLWYLCNGTFLSRRILTC